MTGFTPDAPVLHEIKNHSEELTKAEAGVAAFAAKRNNRWYPKFHIASNGGWINDPNGLCFYKGRWHVFYQLHPYGTQWGPMHWGHVSSTDMLNWKRYGKDAVIDNGKGLSGDPQIVKIGDVWVMFYFGAGWANQGSRAAAFDTFACSYDLKNWTKWTGKNLVEPSESFDKTYAHKPWILKHNGIVYHFYCAVGDRGRNIALATSKDLRGKK